MTGITLISEADENRVRLRCECPSVSCNHWVWVDCHTYNEDYSWRGRVVHPKCKPGHKGMSQVEQFDGYDVVAP